MKISVASVLLALSSIACSNPLAITPRQASGLQRAAKAAGLEYFGTSITIRNDNTESNIMRDGNEFGSLTPENSMKWEAVQPSRGNFQFNGGDQVANFARQNNKQMRCHTLVWHSQLPSWVSNGGFNNATLIQVMEQHIERTMNRWKGQCTHWDVVNEALNEDGTYRNSVFYRVIGPDFIPIAFRKAAQVDPASKLYYNDYNLEYFGPKAQGARRILEHVQSWGVKIDGVGLQGHLVVERTPTQEVITPSLETLENTLRLYTDRNVDVAYTEIDIRMNSPFSAQKLQTQADHYYRVTKSCLNVPRCVGITVWGVSDKYSWVPSTFNGEGSALLWDNNFQKKPAYQGVMRALAEGRPAPAKKA